MLVVEESVRGLHQVQEVVVRIRGWYVLTFQSNSTVCLCILMQMQLCCTTLGAMTNKYLFLFIGVPSPARLKQMESQSSVAVVPNAQSQIVSPLIHAVPLLFKKSGSIENR